MPEPIAKLSTSNFKTALTQQTGSYQAFFSKPAGSSSVSVVLAHANDQAGIAHLQQETGTHPVSVSVNKGIVSVQLGGAAASRSAGASKVFQVE